MKKYVFIDMCEGNLLCRKRCCMFSKEFMKFLYSYQKDDFKPKKLDCAKIRLKKNSGVKVAEVLVVETNKG